MSSDAIIATSAAVVALVQLVKWAGLPDKYGPAGVLLFALVGVGFWAWSHQDFSRAVAFDYFSGWITVATSAAGIFGFTRATTTAVTNMKAPPSAGAGSNPVEKP